MLDFYIPHWLYERLPYLYVAVGIFSLANLEHKIGTLSHSITHKSPIVELAGTTDTLDKDGNLLHAQPNRPGPRFTIVLSAQKAAALGNQAHHSVEWGITKNSARKYFARIAANSSSIDSH